MHDLRSFLETVKRLRPREFVEVARVVNPKHETTAILTKLEQAYRFPILFFRNVAGTRMPAVTNVCGSKARLAMALECPASEVSRAYGLRSTELVKPLVRSDGPVHEHVLMNGEVDLGRLPQFIYHEDDAPQAYITAAIVVARDPETGHRNLSFHRLMITGPSTTTIFMARGRHLDRIYRKYEAAGEAMPVAAFVGVHPACSLGAVYTGDAEEYDVIGGLQQAPLELVRCVTNPLHVPTCAELVLEGFVAPNLRVAEGPFGEFTGCSTGTTCCPVFNVQAMTHRDQPIYQDIVSGHAEHLLLPVLPMEHHFLTLARTAAPGAVDARVPVPLTACVAIDKTDDSEPGRVIDALLPDVYVKQVIVVDADVDPSDMRQVATAMALHMRADRDVLVREATGTELDPASDSHGTTSKLGIDATRPLRPARDVRKNRVRQSLLDSINVADFVTTA